MRKFRCFSCKESKPHSEIKKSGRNKGGRWYLCTLCSSEYATARKLDAEAVSASDRDTVRVGETGSVAMGWNGVPSDRSLRGRNR